MMSDDEQTLSAAAVAVASVIVVSINAEEQRPPAKRNLGAVG